MRAALASSIVLSLALSRAAAAQGGAPPTPPAASSLAERVKDVERHAGFLPYYWDAKKGRLLLEIGALDQDFLYSVGLASGAGVLEASLDRGQLGEVQLVRWERVGPRVLLHAKQTAQRSTTSDRERSRVVAESFPTSIIAALDIVAEDPGRLLVDATDFLLRDVMVGPILRGAELGDFRPDASRSALNFERTGAFPRNTELEAILTFASDNPKPAAAAVMPDGRTMSLRLHHSFFRLPESGYEPRFHDPRVGLLTLRYVDHTAPITEPIERYVSLRWRLKKKDPNAAISEPIEPIVYYLDLGMPEPERSVARRAALWWNRAFEKAGFKNALVIKDLPEGASFLDQRYSGIEWINRAERAWSIGDAQADPRTGEIVHAVARIDSHRRRTTSRIWWNATKPPSLKNGGACLAGDSPDLSFAAADSPGLGIDEQDLVHQRLAYLVAHEVGHTLGFDHNWAATTFGWGSVMEYYGANIKVKNGDLDFSDAYAKDIGLHDELMVHWGYTEEKDPAKLDAIVRDYYAKGDIYPLESDPRWAEYDNGAPDTWLRETLAARKIILDRFGAGQLKPGTFVSDLQQRFSLAYLYHRFGIQAAQQYVGGQFQTNAVAGDGQKPVEWVPLLKQRAALALLTEALSPGSLDIPERVEDALVPAASGTRPTRELFLSDSGNVFSLLSAARSLADLVIRPLLDPERAGRLTLPRDPLKLPDVTRALVEASWNQPPARGEREQALARVAQRSVLDALFDLAASKQTSPEARAVALSTLEGLKTTLPGLKLKWGAAHIGLALRDIGEFLDQPLSRKPQPGIAAPPGRPIG